MPGNQTGASELLEDGPMCNWQPITTAPYGRNLQLSVIERGEVFALVFPCRRDKRGWIDVQDGSPVPVDPTHWREWAE